MEFNGILKLKIKSFEIQFYYPNLSIINNKFFIAFDTRFAIGFKPYGIGLYVLGFGLGFVKYLAITPQKGAKQNAS